LPFKDAAVSGGELSHSTAPSSEGSAPSTGSASSAFGVFADIAGEPIIASGPFITMSAAPMTTDFAGGGLILATRGPLRQLDWRCELVMHLGQIRFFAHSTDCQDQSDWEPLLDHLKAVARTAGENAAKFGAGELGRTAGLLHDLGKYSDKFQKRIMGSCDKVDHAAPGACIAEAQYGKLGKLIGFAVAGHHAGLADGTLTAATQGRTTPLSERLPQYAEAGRKALRAANADGLDLSAAPLTFPVMMPRSKDSVGFSCAFLARMLFSTLVDADYVETERFYAEYKGRAIERGAATSLTALSAALDAHLS
jgi:CRISPR-associated endonuclease Cas3-HD